MGKAEVIHPDDVLQSLLIKAKRSNRKKGLQGLHKLCRVQYDGAKDFSRPVIGRLCDAAGLFKYRVLYNAGAEDYRTLIAAWETFSGPVGAKAKEVPGTITDALLLRIENPAVRTLVQAHIISHKKLRAELDLVKSLTLLEIDRRPLSMRNATSTPSRQKLTDYERDALQRAVSLSFFEDQGWTEGPNGEIVNERGRQVYDVGYTRAIKKALKNDCS